MVYIDKVSIERFLGPKKNSPCHGSISASEVMCPSKIGEHVTLGFLKAP